ncbi:TPA: GNAT family N-acetyltransferase [Candidatus Dependentiae bacterium]|nr:MAG: Acetyltransferase [candidate division TM6 bacterium GW2011_GWE2_31_21]KKP52961.1 MAG: Acetyltransferase [candidate division TM6 bacterium GW2011_GWF2_33_332]HBS47801.1 GNAT family N-acetyltransferase [Candidatus Dependentiae bacterium]HBZ73223.1 GNAT family N-acetyltransferase [Candidatus Dependentiae bacterium]
MEIRKSRKEDIEKIFELYKRVAAIEGGLARTKDEITKEYVEGFLSKSWESGLSLVACDGGKIVAEFHGYASPLKVFSHVMADLTIIVDPTCQGQGLGTAIFTRFLELIKSDFPHILKVELVHRESNSRSAHLYKKLGFVNEGRFVKKIRNVNGGFEDDILMGWFNPNYKD